MNNLQSVAFKNSVLLLLTALCCLSWFLTDKLISYCTCTTTGSCPVLSSTRVFSSTVLAVLGIVCDFSPGWGKEEGIPYCPDFLLLTVHYCKYCSWVSHLEEICNLTLFTYFHFMNHFQHEAGDSGGVLLVALFYFFFNSYNSETNFLNFYQGEGCSWIIYCSVHTAYWFVTKSRRWCGGSWVDYKMKSKSN